MNKLQTVRGSFSAVSTPRIKDQGSNGRLENALDLVKRPLQRLLPSSRSDEKARTSRAKEYRGESKIMTEKGKDGK